jgi:hypothetical protein
MVADWDNQNQSMTKEIDYYEGWNLQMLKKHFQSIQASWNGEDGKFIHEGEIYTEDHVNAAEEIVETIDSLQDMLNNF